VRTHADASSEVELGAYSDFVARDPLAAETVNEE
jgi:hypothetical protein